MKGWKKVIKKIDNQEFATGINTNIFYVGETRKERLNNLKLFVTNECEQCWRNLPAPIATMKRQFLRELVNSLI